jgi:hypothetical protein
MIRYKNWATSQQHNEQNVNNTTVPTNYRRGYRLRHPPNEGVTVKEVSQ